MSTWLTIYIFSFLLYFNLFTTDKKSVYHFSLGGVYLHQFPYFKKNIIVFNSRTYHSSESGLNLPK